MQNPPNASPAAPENRPVLAIPRFNLPDDWSGKGACPVCRTPGRLSVQHQEQAPDRMVCGACGTAFEVETAGTRIRLAAAPPALAARTAQLLDAWLTPAELLLLLEPPPAAAPGSPFEPVLAATHTPNTTAKMPTAPLSARHGPASSEPEPGTEDWFATLAAAIGGQLPIKPPPNAVLADELERALLNRPENGGNGAAAAPAPTVLVGDDSLLAGDDSLMVGDDLLPAAPQAAEPQPAAGPTAPGPVPPAATKTADVVLAEAIAELAAAKAPAAPAARAATPAAVAPMPQPPPVLPQAQPPPSVTAPPPVSALPAAAQINPVSAPAASDATAVVPAGVTLAGAPSPDALPSTPARRELAERAWRLHELGNSLAAIQGALESSGGAPDDIRIVMAKLIALEQARQERFRRTVRQGLIVAAIIVFVLLVIAIVLGGLRPPAVPVVQATVNRTASPNLGTPGPASTAQPGASAIDPTEAATTVAYNPIIDLINQLIPGDVKISNGPSPTPAPTSVVLGALFPATATLSAAERSTAAAKGNGLPSWVATLVPAGVTIINVPTPSIESSGPPDSPCPSSADQASALFGGAAGNWSYNREQQGWIFILADKPATIRVPANMSAGYLVIGASLEMRSQLGPVTLHNVNFVAVSCS